MDLGAVAGAQLGDLLAEKPPRVTVEGPAVNVPGDFATPIGLLIGELAGNASRYGALSGRGGRVRLSWEAIETDRGRRVRLVWREEGAPFASSLRDAGYGAYLIENDLPAAQVQRDRSPSGFVCTVDLPVAGTTERTS